LTVQIDALLEAGITPVVTLFHWDLPQCLADEYDGFRSHRDIIRDFSAYARICFEYLGDRVKHWITINEVNGSPAPSLKMCPYLP
jgi:beta-glucosidase